MMERRNFLKLPLKLAAVMALSGLPTIEAVDRLGVKFQGARLVDGTVEFFMTQDHGLVRVAAFDGRLWVRKVDPPTGLVR